MYLISFKASAMTWATSWATLMATVEFALNRPDLAGPFREYLLRLMVQLNN